jgi:hypothetical protein
MTRGIEGSDLIRLLCEGYVYNHQASPTQD